MEEAAGGGDGERGLGGPVHFPARDAAGGVAAGGGGRAIGVEEIEMQVGIAAMADDGELVEPHAPVSVGQRRGERGRNRRRGRAGVDDDEVVAEAVHLHERQAGLERGLHGSGHSGKRRGNPAVRESP